MDINITTKNSIASLDYKFRKFNKAIEQASPYLNGANLQILSKMMESKVVRKQSTDITSSFAEACKIYKANSDEFRCTKRKGRKDKITPTKNIGPTVPQTVSDMNDSEYLIRVDNNRRYKQKKRRIANISCRRQDVRKYEFYNGDRLHNLAINTDMVNFDDNQLNKCKTLKNKKTKKSVDNTLSSDVWKMLRDMKRFQSVYSPPLSDDSVKTIKKKGKTLKNAKRTGFIETCTTEEFSYISSYDVNSKTRSILSQTSFDRITIIDKTSNAQIREAANASIADTYNPQTIKKSVQNTGDFFRTELLEKSEPLYDNNLSINAKNFTFKNGVYNALEHKDGTIFKAYMSRESLNGQSDSFKSGSTVLNSYRMQRKSPSCVDKSKNFVPKKQSTVNRSLHVNKYSNSNRETSVASEKSSKAGLTSLHITKFSDKLKNRQQDTSNIRKGAENCYKYNTTDRQKNFKCHVVFPKLTRTEIRRRLAILKFPIVILGREEISCTFNVPCYNCSQFDGLDQHIWPYMVEWSGSSFNNNLGNSTRTIHENCLLNSFNRREGFKLTTPSTTKNVQSNINSRKSQNARAEIQLKNKNMGLAPCKNHNILVKQNDIYEKPLNEVFSHYKILSQSIRGSEFGDVLMMQPPFEKKSTADELLKKESHTAFRQPWSKVKWTNNFVDNIIKKLKNGFYYTRNSKDVSNINSEIKTAIETIPKDVTIDETTPKSIDNIVIPGFEYAERLTPFFIEVKMLKRSKISIHHCFTKAVLQFDIAVPCEFEKISSFSLSSFKPLMAHDDETKLYKCNISIPNATLPAQLCCAMPKLINQINESHKNKIQAPNKNCNESQINTNETQRKPHKIIDVLPIGNFCTKSSMSSIPCLCKQNIIDFITSDTVQNLLPVLKLNSTAMPLYTWIRLAALKFDNSSNKEQIISKRPLVNNCTALVPYIPKNATNGSTVCSCTLEVNNTDLQRYLFRINLIADIDIWQKTTLDNHIKACDNGGFRTFCNSLCGSPIIKDSLPSKAITYFVSNVKEKEKRQCRNNKILTMDTKRYLKITLHKARRRKFTAKSAVKNITSLKKIKNIEDFCYAIGCIHFSTVLRGSSEKIIISCIKQLKSWIKCVTREQALLILLLANKKETKNLKRFRSMLLQGIALNRITTAAELDMEIEVIENENICVSQNEGISLLSLSKGFNLLDELYWIAKTTASDYQKPFDDSSRKLLKTLYERRKMLNPSYLRVMARYVGLGLLKPRKC